jgi:hypothetical protein
MNIPYTYLIGWSQYHKFYYGVRYSNNCHPSDLFVTYFTSSKPVFDMINLYGKPDIIQVRKTFLDKFSAINWERKVLIKIKAVKRKDFLNRSDNLFPFCKSIYFTGDDRTDNQKQAAKTHSQKMKGKSTKKAKSILIFGIEYRSVTSALKELKISYSVLKFILNNDISMCNNIDDVKKLIWFRRSEKLKQYRHTDEIKRKLSIACTGRPGTRNGCVTSDLTKQRLSDALTGKKPKIVVCPQCLKEGGINTMKRWHFNNCKYKAGV